MQAKVSLDLSAVLNLTEPPESVTTVEEYRTYIRQLLIGPPQAPARAVGRPPRTLSHPCYSETEMVAIKKLIVDEAAALGLVPTLSKLQPDDPTMFRLSDGQTCLVFSDRLKIENGIASYVFPPSVYYGDV